MAAKKASPKSRKASAKKATRKVSEATARGMARRFGGLNTPGKPIE